VGRQSPGGLTLDEPSSQDTSSPASETIGVTANHPFWSVDHQAFVPVGHLEPGTRVKTHLDQIQTIVSLHPRPGPPEKVYNLEVHGEHVYYVGLSSVLVHNSYPTYIRYMSEKEYLDFVARGNRLAMREGHGGYKRVIDGSFTGPGGTSVKNLNSGSKNKYVYKVTITGKPELKQWMEANAHYGANAKSAFGHPDTWEIPADKLDQFNSLIKSISVTKL
jgi:hypothetical protein